MMRGRILLLLGVAVLLIGLAAGGCTTVPAAAQEDPTPQATDTPAPTATAQPKAAQEDGEAGEAKPDGLRLFRSPDRGWLGIEIQSAEGGVEIVRVVPDSPAAAAGLQEGDIVKQIDGQDVAEAKDLTSAMASVKPGTTVRLSIQRGDSTQEIEVTADNWPGPSLDVRSLVPDLPLGGWSLLPPGLEQLKDIPSGEAFDHFRGGQFTFTDGEGNEFVVNLTPGKVVAVSDAEVTVDVNGDAGERTFKVDDETTVRPGGNRTEGLAVDDQVVVVTLDESETAALIARVGMPRIDWSAPRDSLERFFRDFGSRTEPSQPTPAEPQTGPRA